MSVDYDELWSEQWGQLQEFGPSHRHLTRIIVETVRGLPINSVVDVGCGTGDNLAALQRETGIKDIVGMDISKTAVEVARRRIAGEFLAMDVVHDPPLDRTFDLVLSSQVIEHVAEDDVFLARLYDLCGKYCFVGTMQGRMRPSEATIGHLRNYTRRGLEEKMEHAGFTIEKVIEWGFPFVSPLYRTFAEFFGGHAIKVGERRRLDRFLSAFLYQLYRLNSSRHGDVLMILARR